jgi:hypothetical protein
MSESVPLNQDPILVLIINDVHIPTIEPEVDSSYAHAVVDILDPLRVSRSVHIRLVDDVLIGLKIEGPRDVLELILDGSLEDLVFTDKSLGNRILVRDYLFESLSHLPAKDGFPDIRIVDGIFRVARLMLEFLERSNDIFCLVVSGSVGVKDKLCSDHRYRLLLLDLDNFLLNLFETPPRAWLVRCL